MFTRACQHQHQLRFFPVAFENAPTSLRDVEETFFKPGVSLSINSGGEAHSSVSTTSTSSVSGGPGTALILNGSQTTLYGQGFVSNETVNIFWNYKQAGQVLAGTVTAASDGTFSFTTMVPSDPNLGNITIAAIGTISKLTATTSIYEYAALVLTPSNGPPGTTVNVNGGGFGSAETVTVSYQGSAMGTATTDTSGAFTFSFVVPTKVGPGNTIVNAVGNTSGVSASTSFYVTPPVTLTPTTGSSGTQITVTENCYTPSYYAYLYCHDPGNGSYIYFGTFPTTSADTFTTTITALAGLTSGNTYHVQGYDGSTGMFAQAAFVAQ